MPVTKKKGAIFAIYSDSPQQTTTSTSTSTLHAPVRSPTKRPHTSSASKSAGLKSKPLGLSSSTSLSAQGTGPRKALSSVQPRGLASANTTPDLFKPTAEGLKRPLGDSNYPVKPKPPLGTKAASPSKPAKAAPSAIEGKLPPRTPKRALETGIKEDKENLPPPGAEREIAPIPSDSPASRTRSKTRSNSTATALSALTVTSSPRIGMGSGAPAGEMVGDGRGALSLKKGRAVAALLAGQDEDENETVFGGSMRSLAGGRVGPTHASGATGSTRTMTTVTTTPRSKRTGASPKSTGKGKGKRAVPADQPLADVSEAYGATGQEPEGFRDVY